MKNLVNFLLGIPRTTVRAMRIFWDSAKGYKLDAAIAILSLAAIVAWAFWDDFFLEGAAAVLFVYAFGNTIRFSNHKIIIKKLQDLIDKKE